MHQTSRESGGYGKLKERGGGRTLHTQIIKSSRSFILNERSSEMESLIIRWLISAMFRLSRDSCLSANHAKGVKKNVREKTLLGTIGRKVAFVHPNNDGSPFKFKFSESIKTISAG